MHLLSSIPLRTEQIPEFQIVATATRMHHGLLSKTMRLKGQAQIIATSSRLVSHIS